MLLAVRTGDGKDVDWEYSDAPQCSATAQHLERLLNGDAASRAIAHAELSEGQLLILYRATRGVLEHGKRFRCVGRALIRLDCATYAEGVGILKLARLVAKHKERSALISALLDEGKRR